MAAEIKKSSWGGKRTGAGRPRTTTARAAAYEAAEPATRGRTFIYMPTLEARDELTNWSRSEIQRKARWLYNNEPKAARLIDGISRNVTGNGLWPQARTANKEWNRLAEEAFEDACGREAFGFDVGAEVNFYEAQLYIMRHVAIDGDFFGQFMLSSSGRAMMRFVGAEHVGNGQSPLQDEWRDGVRTDAYGKPTQYRMLTDIWGRNWRDVSADDVIHFKRPVRRGYTRSPSWLARATAHLHDAADITSFNKQSHKLAAQTAFVIESPEAGQLGMGAALRKVEVAGGSVTVDKLYSSSGIMQLKPGERVQQFKNEHPGSTFEPLMNYLARDIAYSMGISPEVIFSPQGLTGPAMRAALVDAQTLYTELQNWLVENFCRRFWKYWIWHEIEAGRLPMPGEDWWRVEFTRPARNTIDFGRDTKAMLDIARAGAMSPRRFAEMHGYDAEQEDDDIIAAFVRRKQKCEEAGVTLEEVFPPAPGSPVTSQGSQPGIDASGDTSNDDDADEADSDSTPSDSTAL